MTDRIAELRKAYDAAADSLATKTAAVVAADTAYAYADAANEDAAADAYAAADADYFAARRLWREAKAALDAAEREVRGE